MNDIEIIKVERLREFVSFPINWNDVLVDLNDVNELINQVECVYDYYPKLLNNTKIKSVYSKEWHIGRIKYFVEYPHKISPISIDNECAGGVILGLPKIIDGHHRFIAAIIRNDETIQVFYSGLIDSLNYLKGINNNMINF